MPQAEGLRPGISFWELAFWSGRPRAYTRAVVYRSLLLGLGRNPVIRAAVEGSGPASRLARRFVAGEAPEDALGIARSLASRGILSSLDLLGEEVRDAAASSRALEIYLALVEAIASEDLPAGLSVKLTQFGLDLSPDLALENAAVIAAKAAEAGIPLALDMEDSSRTDRILGVAKRLSGAFPNLEVALQAYLFRTPFDLEELLDRGLKVRLCKGAYSEPPSLAYQRGRDVRQAFARLLGVLARRARTFAVATHDPRLLRLAKAMAFAHGRNPAELEFQMLYGVRRDLQEDLSREGWRLRVYIPFGREWYPYLLRRLAERPRHLALLVGSLARGVCRSEVSGGGGRSGAGGPRTQ